MNLTPSVWSAINVIHALIAFNVAPLRRPPVARCNGWAGESFNLRFGKEEREQVSALPEGKYAFDERVSDLHRIIAIVQEVSVDFSSAGFIVTFRHAS